LSFILSNCPQIKLSTIYLLNGALRHRDVVSVPDTGESFQKWMANIFHHWQKSTMHYALKHSCPPNKQNLSGKNIYISPHLVPALHSKRGCAGVLQRAKLQVSNPF
jgi:hypothetical protein